jgi:glucosamine--fructose-6-phosphate aminotransferase (isomerizing)
MCGIFGYLIKQGSDIQAEELRDVFTSLVRLSESRGKEAAGMALVDNAMIRVYKEAKSGSLFIKTKTFARLFAEGVSSERVKDSALGVIGHTRLVTNGSMEHRENNQPVIRDALVGIHNGIIVNDQSIFQNHEFERRSEVDTDVLLALLESYKDLPLQEAFYKAFQEVKGTASVALLFRDSPFIVLASNNGSLYFLKNVFGSFFASEKAILEQLVRTHPRVFSSSDKIEHVSPGSGLVMYLKDGTHTDFSLVRPQEQSLLYRGGLSLTFRDEPSEFAAPIASLLTTKDISEALVEGFRRDYEATAERVSGIRRCSRCILPATMPFIIFDDQGICNYCTHYEKSSRLGEGALREQIEKFRGDGQELDCLFPLSGGRDSCYGLHYVKEILHLNPIAYSYDWGMLTDLGRRNQARMCGALGVEHLLVSANIPKKRRYIRQNVLAWLRRPELGTVPLFMAGDKQYFYYLNKLKSQVRSGLVVYCENPLEQTNFKYGFCGVPPKFNNQHVYRIGLQKKLALAFSYAKSFLRNPAYLNSSLLDTLGAYASTYVVPHEYVYLYNYLPWDEDVINRTLIDQYDWELAPDSATTWRIGDGTAALYNLIYYTGAGLTENDTFRSNQIREGMITREDALKRVETENRPRFDSIKWYCDVIGLDFVKTVSTIFRMDRLY